MYKLSNIESHYITPCRTIETIYIKNPQGKEKIVYVYNYEGYHYRVFGNVIELTNFLSGDDYNLMAEYSTDSGLDNFLAKIDVN